MEDGQDSGHSADTEPSPAAISPGEPLQETPGMAEVGGQVAASTDDLEDSSLTGVIAALDEMEPSATQEVETASNAEAEGAGLPPVEVAGQADAAEPVVAAGQVDAAEPVGETVPEATPPATGSAQLTPVAAPGAEHAERNGAVPIWPFLVYFALWVVFAGALAWQFSQTPAGTPLYELDIYGPSILAGLALTGLGPILGLGVWLALWVSRPGARTGLFGRSFLMGAVVTLAGVALWLVALGAVDMYRLGRLI